MHGLLRRTPCIGKMESFQYVVLHSCMESSNQGLYIHVTSMRDLHHGFCWTFVLAGHLAIYRVHAWPMNPFMYSYY